ATVPASVDFAHATAGAEAWPVAAADAAGLAAGADAAGLAAGADAAGADAAGVAGAGLGVALAAHPASAVAATTMKTASPRRCTASPSRLCCRRGSQHASRVATRAISRRDTNQRANRLCARWIAWFRLGVFVCLGHLLGLIAALGMLEGHRLRTGG